MRIVLGLGNPGRRYERTRHNIGFRAVEALAGRLGASFRLRPVGDDAEVALSRVNEEDVVIAKPMTWMNRSGVAAERLAAAYGAAPGDIIVAYDDVALPLGRIRVRGGGRSAGQKGMESIIRTLGTEEIPRVRMGILGERDDAELADYVLEPFDREEVPAVDRMIEAASAAVLAVIDEGVREAMNRFNHWGEEPA